MRWQKEWELISNRIVSIVEMSQFYSAGLVSRGLLADMPDATGEIYRSADDVSRRLAKFREHNALLPQLAGSRLSEVVNDLLRYPAARQRDYSRRMTKR